MIDRARSAGGQLAAMSSWRGENAAGGQSASDNFVDEAASRLPYDASRDLVARKKRRAVRALRSGTTFALAARREALEGASQAT